jgi:16S rRNA (uracil1498-N3)-methyltransferase
MKKLHRFYLQKVPTEETFSITEPKLVHQLSTVLRYAPDEELIIFSEGSDDIVVRIVAMQKKEIEVHKERTIPAIPIPSRKIIAAVSIIKRDLFELIVQKLTELGVQEVVPILADRTVKLSINMNRLATISREATEQSGQNTLVHIHEPMTLATCLTTFPHPSIVFDPRETSTPITATQRVVMYIGPEGGWSPDDIALFRAHDVHFQKLGSTILRTETAAIVGAYSILS